MSPTVATLSEKLEVRYVKAHHSSQNQGFSQLLSPCTVSKGFKASLGNQEAPPSYIVPSLNPLLT